MRVLLTDYPRYVPGIEYESTIGRMIDKISRWDGIVSVYQIGSVSNPGISDIDLLVVFKDNAKCHFNPRQDLTATERYLFVHGLYGGTVSHVMEAQEFTFFHNYQLLWGDKLLFENLGASKKETQELKVQTALEYLIRMFINRVISQLYGVIRVREILLHTKALLYDLEFLHVYSGKLFELIKTIIDWQKNWIEKRIEKDLLKQWVVEFNRELIIFLKGILDDQPFYLPQWADYSITRNIRLLSSKEIGYAHKGISLPLALRIFGKKAFNLQHRFNFFQFCVPITSQKMPGCVERRFVFLRKMKRQNNSKFPHFMPMTSSLDVL